MSIRGDLDGYLARDVTIAEKVNLVLDWLKHDDVAVWLESHVEDIDLNQWFDAVNALREKCGYPEGARSYLDAKA